MAKGCFSMNSKLLSLDIRFDIHGLLRDLELQTDTSLIEATIHGTSSTDHEAPLIPPLDIGAQYKHSMSAPMNIPGNIGLHSMQQTRKEYRLPPNENRGPLPSVGVLLLGVVL
jgi:hypothetical protein